MSHGKLRKAKNCLNCGSIVKGPYCHICGQHNTEPQETLWDLLSHFVYDITHFDGKFFHGIKTLLLKPGFLSKEYMRGRRAAHINPIRFYVFTSAFFFLVIFSTTHTEDVINFGTKESELVVETKALRQQLLQVHDSTERKRLEHKISSNDSLLISFESLGIIEKTDAVPDSVRERLAPAFTNGTQQLRLIDSLPATISAYEAEQAALPAGKRDNMLKRFTVKKAILINNKYHSHWGEFREKFVEKFLHSIPKMMFVSLPFVAFFLWLLYARHKKFYYVHHAILVIHDYIAIYILILFIYLSNWLGHLVHWRIFSWLSVALAIYCFYYVEKSMRNFYAQSRGKTVFKFVIFLLMVLFMFSVLSVGFVVNSLLQV